MTNTVETVDKIKHETTREFYESKEFAEFEKNSLSKIVEIAKKFKLYPNPSVNDFKESSYDNSIENCVILYSTNLAERSSNKMFPAVKLKISGDLVKDNDFDGDGKKKSAQLMCVDVDWSFSHYGGGSNGAGILRAHFDKRGKLAYLNMMYMPEKLYNIQQELQERSPLLGESFIRKLPKEERNLKRAQSVRMIKLFEKKCNSLIDKDNIMSLNGYKSHHINEGNWDIAH